MFLIPAIDLKDGSCVRLVQGEFDSAKTYYRNPSDAAKYFADAGADLIHVVDLDGAKIGKSANRAAVESILKIGRVKVQLGGGIRNSEMAETWLKAGVFRVIAGTHAAENPREVLEWIERRPHQICVAIDARDGRVALWGWTSASRTSAIDLAKRFDVPAIGAIIFTDISRDGMQTGANIEAVRDIAKAVSSPVIASGGVASIEDINGLAEAPEGNIVGVISGRAIYERNLDLGLALAVKKRFN
jgi:phosphoribosylformimino-5-aminoimidazole carboxamide ribotide isomerase